MLRIPTDRMNQLAILKEWPRNAENKSNKRSGWDLNSEPPDYKYSFESARPRWLLKSFQNTTTRWE